MWPPKNTMSVPGLVWANMSALAAVRVKRGSTTIILAGFFSLETAWSIHFMATGWFSATLEPHTMKQSLIFMSWTWLVMTPRPYVFAKLATDGPCHNRAWCSMYTCLLYTSDAADDLLCVDLGGGRIIKKKKNNDQNNK